MKNEFSEVLIVLEASKEATQMVVDVVLSEAQTSTDPTNFYHQLESSGVNAESLSRYFEQLVQLQALSFYHDGQLRHKEHGISITDVRNLWMPVTFGTILGTIGDTVVGAYDVKIVVDEQVDIDTDFVKDMSSKLQSLNMRRVLTSVTGQIGFTRDGGNKDVMAHLARDAFSTNVIATSQDVDPRTGVIAQILGFKLLESDRVEKVRDNIRFATYTHSDKRAAYPWINGVQLHEIGNFVAEHHKQ